MWEAALPPLPPLPSVAGGVLGRDHSNTCVLGRPRACAPAVSLASSLDRLRCQQRGALQASLRAMSSAWDAAPPLCPAWQVLGRPELVPAAVAPSPATVTALPLAPFVAPAPLVCYHGSRDRMCLLRALRVWKRCARVAA